MIKKYQKKNRLALNEWKKIRAEVLNRDQDKCRYPKCTVIRANQVHHIIPFRDSGDDDPKNLVTLCERHHAITDNRVTKVGMNSQDKIWLRENYGVVRRSEARIKRRNTKKIKPSPRNK